MNKKIVISQKNVWKVLFFFCAIVALNVPGSIFYNDYSENLIVIFGVIEIAITGLICIKSSKLNSLLATGIAEFVTPFFVVTVVSCVSAAVIHQTSNVGDITQSFIRAIQIAAVFIIAYNAVKKFGKISLDILLIAGCISYATVILRVISGESDVSHLESHGFIETTVGRGSFVSAQNKDFIKEEKQKQIEEHLLMVVDMAKSNGIDLEKLIDLLFIFYLGEDN